MDSYDLLRFTKMHKQDFNTALSEIKNGKKITHWMWYIFPQIYGLGKSDIAVTYAIKSLDEAKCYIKDKYLGGNMTKLCETLLSLETNDAEAVFGYIDSIKLKSSITLFECAAEDKKLFGAVLDKYFAGERDTLTHKIIKGNKTNEA